MPATAHEILCRPSLFTLPSGRERFAPDVNGYEAECGSSMPPVFMVPSRVSRTSSGGREKREPRTDGTIYKVRVFDRQRPASSFSLPCTDSGI